MIDYYFPPMAGVGVQRTLNYVKHLHEFGWSPIVLTVRDGDDYVYDASLLEDLPPGVDVERTASLEPIRLFRRAMARVRQRGRLSGPKPYAGAPLWGGSPWVRAVERWVSFPDRRVGWLPFAVSRAARVARCHSIDAIYSTSTVVTSHLIAYTLTKLLHKPWVADFQDWWAEDRIGSVQRWAGKRLESMILHTAARTTFTTEPLRQMFHAKYPQIPEQKLVTIPMGFDPKAFLDITPVPREKFTVIHFGSFYSPRSPGPFLQALAKCVEADPDLAQHVEVFFFGRLDAEMLRLANGLIREGGLARIVHLAGVISYRAGLQQLVSADVLLLVTAPGMSGQTHIPSKLFEYLAAGRPILALAPEGGGAARVVEETNAGVIVDPSDVGGIRNAIRKLYQQWTERRLVFPIDRAAVGKYAWGQLSGRFAATLEDAVASSWQ